MTDLAHTRFRAITYRGLAVLRRQWPVILGVIILAGLLLWLRGDVLLAQYPFNPDESELLGEGKRAFISLIPYAEVTTSTHLIVWPWFLGVLGHLGFALSLPFAHLLSGLFYLAMVAILWVFLANRIAIGLAVVAAIGPALLLFSGAVDADLAQDYLSLTSESLPIVMLIVAAAVTFMRRGPGGTARLIVAAALVGLAPWAKLQVLPLALGMLAVILVSHNQAGATRDAAPSPPGNRWRRPLIGGGAFIAPTVLIMVAMGLGGTLGRFISEPVMLQLNYATNRAAVQAQAPGLAARVTMLAPIILAIVPMLLVAGTREGGSLMLSPRSWRQSARRLGLIALLAFPVVGALSAAAPGQYFPHYGNLLWGGGMLGVMCGMGLAGARAQQPSWSMTRMDSITACAAAILMVLSVWPFANEFQRGKLPEAPESVFALAQPERPDDLGLDLRELATKCPPSSRVLAWGWAPEFYSFINWTPASRYVISTWVRSDLPEAAEYRARLSAELAASPPACIVEFTGPAFFGGFAAEDTIAAHVPAVQPLLKRCYRSEIVNILPAPVRVFVRKPQCAAAG